MALHICVCSWYPGSVAITNIRTIPKNTLNRANRGVSRVRTMISRKNQDGPTFGSMAGEPKRCKSGVNTLPIPRMLNRSVKNCPPCPAGIAWKK